MRGPMSATLIILLAVLAMGALAVACASRRAVVVHQAPCGDATLRVEKRREMVELAWQDRFDLALMRPGANTAVRLTGNVGVLPRAKRYRDMIAIADFREGSRPAMGELFTTHYISPRRITREEFDEVCRVYRHRRAEWSVIAPSIGLLVYGEQRMFHEVFDCGSGLYLYTDLDGNILITDDPAYESLSRIAERRHMNHVAFFTDDNRLIFRTGRIVSGVENDLFGRPSKRVAYSGIAGIADYANHVDVRWCDLLYETDRTGINASLLRSAKNRDGKRLDEIFRAAD